MRTADNFGQDSLAGGKSVAGSLAAGSLVAGIPAVDMAGNQGRAAWGKLLAVVQDRPQLRNLK